MSSAFAADPTSSAQPAPNPPTFLEPRALIAASGVRRFVPPAWPVLVIGAVLIIASASLDGSDGAANGGQIALVFGLIMLWIGNGIVRRSVARRVNAEVDAVTALEELVQLRRWPEAADLAQRILTRPMYLGERRLSALVSLATLLARYHRFSEARIVHEYLLSFDGLNHEGSTGHSIRVARAMSMLREDHLVDADKAMSDLRREVNRARDEVRRDRGPEAAAEIRSGGLALLELYRDVKTGHYEEASHAFDRSLPTLREQLGMRVADAWLLVAAARDKLGLTAEAALAYTNATTLAPAVELHRRYPETAALREKYTATTSPSGAPETLPASGVNS